MVLPHGGAHLERPSCAVDHSVRGMPYHLVRRMHEAVPRLARGEGFGGRVPRDDGAAAGEAAEIDEDSPLWCPLKCGRVVPARAADCS